MLLVILLALVLIAAVMVAVRRYHKAQWAKRPERLCLACEAVHQPDRIANTGFRCPTCAAPGPVLLDSAAAEAHRKAKAAGVVSRPNPKVWVPRPKDDITRYG